MITPELLISDDALIFPRTVVGKPVFMVLRVAADERNIQVMLATDQPDLFQLADDNRPLFSTSLLLTPESAGTYVHIRYLPTRTGTHEATLTLESALGTRTVSLTGRSSRLSTRSTSGNKALSRTVVTSRRSNSTAGWVAAGLGSVALLAGLIYAGITYRCTLIPSLCREETAAGPLVLPKSVTPERTEDKATVPARAPKSIDPTPGYAAKVTEPVSKVQPARSDVVAKPVPVTRPISRSIEKPQSATRLTAPKGIPPAPASVLPARPKKATGATEESELERELNGTTN